MANQQLENEVWEALDPQGDGWAAGDSPSVSQVLDAIPEGWLKYKGEWHKLDDVDLRRI